MNRNPSYNSRNSAPASTGEVNLTDRGMVTATVLGVATLTAIGLIGGPDAYDRMNGAEFEGEKEQVTITEDEINTLSDVANEVDNPEGVDKRVIIEYIVDMPENKGVAVEPGAVFTVPGSTNP